MLTAGDKAWLRKEIKRIVERSVEQLVSEAASGHGGYDGATSVTDDEWAEEGRRRRVGFQTVGMGPMT